REAYGMFAVNGILFNHESPRRGETFVTRKITRAVAAIQAGRQEHLYLGNLDAVRDWGYAAEYVEGMWRMLQADEPDDYVLATGTGLTVRDFLDESFSHVGLRWQDHVRFDERYLRPSEVDALVGDPSKAHAELGWKPTVDGRALARIMVDADVEALGHAGSPWTDRAALAPWEAAGRRPTSATSSGTTRRPSTATRCSTSRATAASSGRPCGAASSARASPGSWGARRPSSTSRTATRRSRSSASTARATWSSRRRRSAGSWRTPPTRSTSSPRTCGSRSTCSTRRAPSRSSACCSSGRRASTRGSRRSRSPRTRSSPGTSSRRTTRTRSRRS